MKSLSNGKGKLGRIRISQIHSVRLTKRNVQAGRRHGHHAPASGHHNNHEHAQYQHLNDQEFLSMRD